MLHILFQKGTLSQVNYIVTLSQVNHTSSKKVVDKTESRCYYLTQTDEGEVKLRNDLQRTGDGASPADADSDKWSPEGGAKRQPCLSSSRRKAGVIWPRV
jgi:hypothetical protein